MNNFFVLFFGFFNPMRLFKQLKRYFRFGKNTELAIGKLVEVVIEKLHGERFT